MLLAACDHRQPSRAEDFDGAAASIPSSAWTFMVFGEQLRSTLLRSPGRLIHRCAPQIVSIPRPFFEGGESHASGADERAITPLLPFFPPSGRLAAS